MDEVVTWLPPGVAIVDLGVGGSSQTLRIDDR